MCLHSLFILLPLGHGAIVQSAHQSIWPGVTADHVLPVCCSALFSLWCPSWCACPVELKNALMFIRRSFSVWVDFSAKEEALGGIWQGSDQKNQNASSLSCAVCCTWVHICLGQRYCYHEEAKKKKIDDCFNLNDLFKPYVLFLSNKCIVDIINYNNWLYSCTKMPYDLDFS